MLNPRAGFTIVEVIVALVILATAVLGLAGSVTRLTAAAAGSERRAQAVYSVEDRLDRIEMDGRYDALDSLYVAVESDTPLPGLSRTTAVTHVDTDSPTPRDYRVVTVTVAGIGLVAPVARTLIIAAP